MRAGKSKICVRMPHSVRCVQDFWERYAVPRNLCPVGILFKREVLILTFSEFPSRNLR